MWEYICKRLKQDINLPFCRIGNAGVTEQVWEKTEIWAENLNAE